MRYLARVSRQEFRIRDTYGVEVVPGIGRIYEDEVRGHQVR